MARPVASDIRIRRILTKRIMVRSKLARVILGWQSFFFFFCMYVISKCAETPTFMDIYAMPHWNYVGVVIFDFSPLLGTAGRGLGSIFSTGRYEASQHYKPFHTGHATPPRLARQFAFPTSASRKSAPSVKTPMKNTASSDLVALANAMNLMIPKYIHGEATKCWQMVSFVFRCAACRVFSARGSVSETRDAVIKQGLLF